MPNHCHNDLYVGGSKEQVDALLSHIGADKLEPHFDFGTVIPYPAEFASRDKEMQELGYKAFAEKYGSDAKDGYNSGGYEWCISNWGTKWNSYEVARRDYGGVCITFQTAWSPPKPVIVALHKLFPLCSLHIESFERGAAYATGFSILSKEDFYCEDSSWSAGHVIDEWQGKYLGNRGG